MTGFNRLERPFAFRRNDCSITKSIDFAVLKVVQAAQSAAQRAPPTLTTWLAGSSSGQDEDETLAGFLSEINSLEFGEVTANLCSQIYLACRISIPQCNESVWCVLLRGWAKGAGEGG